MAKSGWTQVLVSFPIENVVFEGVIQMDMVLIVDRVVLAPEEVLLGFRQ